MGGVVQDHTEFIALLSEIVKKAVAEAMRGCEPRGRARLSFSEKEAADLLGVKPYVLRDARRRGEVKATKIGRKVAYTPRQLESYLDRENEGDLR
jgi:hypothetical protein